MAEAVAGPGLVENHSQRYTSYKHGCIANQIVSVRAWVTNFSSCLFHHPRTRELMYVTHCEIQKGREGGREERK